MKLLKNWIKTKLRTALGLNEIEEHLRQSKAEASNQIKSVNSEIEEQFRQAKTEILDQIRYVNYDLYLHLQEAQRLRNLYYRDILLILDRFTHLLPAPFVELETQYPIAVDSDDHKFPWGTINDNTRSPRFVYACETLFKKPINFLDLGCSGGGLTLDFILRGHKAVGLEGSNLSQRGQRAEWRLLPNNLFTCDITKPFCLREQGKGEVMKFDVVSAWEVMEHIAEKDLPQFFDNILLHLSNEGIFVGSISTVPDTNPETGAIYHLTVESKEWWKDRFFKLGLEFTENHPFSFYDFCRGTGNGPIDENYLRSPNVGFHFVACKNNNL